MPSAARFPGGFDAASFLRGAKMNFVKLQLANDQGKLDDIREFTTDEMFEALERDVIGATASASRPTSSRSTLRWWISPPRVSSTG
jgi:predicted lipid-binding transport protein (Tim44 family)